MDWFIYDNGLRHERVNMNKVLICTITIGVLKSLSYIQVFFVFFTF